MRNVAEVAGDSSDLTIAVQPPDSTSYQGAEEMQFLEEVYCSFRRHSACERRT